MAVMSFDSVSDFVNYCIDHPEASNSVSPGGAASMLGVSRQRVHSLMSTGKLRAWVIYERGLPCDDPPGNWASFIYVSVDDIEARLAAPVNKGGRPRKDKSAAA